MTNILGQCRQQVPFLLIEAPVSFADRGRTLLHHFIKEAAEQNGKVHLLQCDVPHTFAKKAWIDLPVKVHNYPESSKWDVLQQETDGPTPGVAIMQRILQEEVSKATKLVLAIDSLSTLLVYEDAGSIYRALQQYITSNNYVMVIAFVHSDSHSKPILEKLRYIAPGVVSIKESNKTEFVCSVTWRKKSGKTLTQAEKYEMDENLRLKLVKDTKPLKSISDNGPISQTVPQSTFRLGLTPKEESERSQVVLPFQRVEQASQIVYEPDEEDFEDPDDDLEV